jgi:hypothetical protein
MEGLVFVYTGAHGPANGLGLLLDAAERLLEHLPQVNIWLMGDGLQKPAPMQQAADRNLSNVRFLDPIPKSEIPRLLRGASSKELRGSTPSSSSTAHPCCTWRTHRRWLGTSIGSWWWFNTKVPSSR